MASAAGMQKRDAGGKISFVEHLIMNDFGSQNAGGVTFSELHALTTADIDGDGIQDIVTGKRHWAHLDSYTDADAQGAAVLLVSHGAKWQGTWRRGVRARADPQPVGCRLDDSDRGSEQGRRRRHHGGDQPGRPYLLEQARGGVGDGQVRGDVVFGV